MTEVKNINRPQNLAIMQANRHLYSSLDLGIEGSCFVSSNSSYLLDLYCKIQENKRISSRFHLRRSQSLENRQFVGDFIKKEEIKGLKPNKQQVIEKANSSVRELSQQNRMKSRSKIKAQQMCFRFKLKMITLLRRLNFKSEQVQKLQQQEPEEFIHNFTNKLASLHKTITSEYNSLKEKYSALSLTLKVKTQQFCTKGKEYAEREKQMAQRMRKLLGELKDAKVGLMQNGREIDSLKMMICGLEAKIHEVVENCRIVQSDRDIVFKSTEKCLLEIKGLKQTINKLQQTLQKKQIQNCSLTIKLHELKMLGQHKFVIPSTPFSPTQSEYSFCEKKISLQNAQTQTHQEYEHFLNSKEVASIIEQWKNRMYETVNQYEKIIAAKDVQIKALVEVGRRFGLFL